MNYGEIKNFDIANGEGVRVSLFVSGCTHHCKNCFNPETWSFDYGEPFTAEVEDKIISELEPDYINGLSLLGGEPFEPSNRARCEHTDEMLSLIDVLVDGEFVQELYNISLQFRGSSNQRIIDVQKSLNSGKLTEYVPKSGRIEL